MLRSGVTSASFCPECRQGLWSGGMAIHSIADALLIGKSGRLLCHCGSPCTDDPFPEKPKGCTGGPMAGLWNVARRWTSGRNGWRWQSSQGFSGWRYRNLPVSRLRKVAVPPVTAGQTALNKPQDESLCLTTRYYRPGLRYWRPRSVTLWCPDQRTRGPNPCR